MKSNFDKEIDNAVAEMLESFGVDAWVRGINYPAIFNDQEFEDEAGYRHDLSIEIESKHAQYFAEGDSVVVMCNSYTVRQPPRASTEDPFVVIGLKRA